MRILPILIAVVSLTALAAAEPVKFPTLKTTDGKEYVNVTVTEKRADGISISHEAGTGRIPYEKLPADVRKQLGGFDETQAKKARQEDQAAQAANEAAWAKAEAENDKAFEQAANDLAPATQPGGQAPGKIEPKNKDKLLAKVTKYLDGGGKGVDVIARAGAKDLVVTWVGIDGLVYTKTAAAWTKLRFEARVPERYRIVASEAGSMWMRKRRGRRRA